ncbi:diguanylate cyclase [Paraburkholderia silviterrae]|uniref:diguanylate cyclase n=2 Tax=Paraburkholderia silviterrae TaxID=2528715 RepID=A0A4R5M4L8_9BURK|nr:diguanylate cyclase [Paraburkholderia silviterrae]
MRYGGFGSNERVGGGEFVLVAADRGDDGQLCELASRLIACVLNVGEGEYDGRFPLRVSIGIATFPDRAKTTEELLDLADSAMYAAKRAGRSTCRFGASLRAATDTGCRSFRYLQECKYNRRIHARRAAPSVKCEPSGVNLPLRTCLHVRTP